MQPTSSQRIDKDSPGEIRLRPRPLLFRERLIGPRSLERLPQSLSILTLVLGILLCATWAAVRFTTEQLLYHEATSAAQNWAGFLAHAVKDLRQIAAGEQPSTQSMAFFELTQNAGQVFRYEVFNRDGYSQLVADRQKIFQVSISDFSADAASAAQTRAPVVNVRQSRSPGMPEFFSEAFIPVVVDGEPIAVVAAYVDQTAQRNRYRIAFVASGLSICAMTVLAFSVPVGAWYRRTREKQRVDAELRFLAHHDSLTRLANRVTMIEKLREILDRPGGARTGTAIHCLDLDRFKEVNDTFGHDAGNILLRSMADRLRGISRTDDIVARLGGDEFVFVQAAIADRADAENLAARIVAAINEPFEIAGHTLSVTVSVGVAVAPDDGTVPEQLLKCADLALYKSKAQGRSCYRFFTPDMNVVLQQRLAIEKAIRHAIQHSGFALHFQPLVTLTNETPVGFEALVRLTLTDGTVISPSVFVPLAEEMGLISQMGEWVIREACTAATTWPPHLTVAVNLSAAQFGHDTICKVVTDALRSTGLEPARLELEITETTLLKDTELVMAELHQLKQLGVSIAMDDFGIGYSSLNYLWRFPFNKVKIDRSFIASLGQPDNSVETIIGTIVTLGHSLNMRVTVEGIENVAQLHFARSLACDEAQGFYFGRPMSADDLAAFLLSSVRGRGGSTASEQGKGGRMGIVEKLASTGGRGASPSYRRSRP
jgi:diguanylate cyclase (GGDEF)-like protein